MLDFNHIYKVLATSILETVAPTRCAVCDAPGETLCADCAASLPFIDISTACPRCGAPFGARGCTECPAPGSEVLQENPGLAFPFLGARAALSYEDAAKSLIRVYKDGDELRLASVIAHLICKAISGNATSGDGGDWLELTTGDGGGWSVSTNGDSDGNIGSASSARTLPDWTLWADALVYVPASPEAVRRRDFDHMQRVAALCGRITGLPVLNALQNRGKALDQRKLGRTQRMENRSGSFSASKELAFGKRIILIDDVFTTGATLRAATHALLDAGAIAVVVAVCARVW